MLEQPVPEGLDPVEESLTGTVLEDCEKDLCWRCTWRTVSDGKDSMLEHEESVRNPVTVIPPLQEKAHQVFHLNKTGEKH